MHALSEAPHPCSRASNPHDFSKWSSIHQVHNLKKITPSHAKTLLTSPCCCLHACAPLQDLIPWFLGPKSRAALKGYKKHSGRDQAMPNHSPSALAAASPPLVAAPPSWQMPWPPSARWATASVWSSPCPWPCAWLGPAVNLSKFCKLRGIQELQCYWFLSPSVEYNVCFILQCLGSASCESTDSLLSMGSLSTARSLQAEFG